MNTVYKKQNYKVYSMSNEYIIHNSDKEFNIGHTHLRNFKTCVYIIDLAIHRSIPRHLNTYFIVSLKRISTDEEYIRKLEELLDAKNKKSNAKYRNTPKCKIKKK